MEPLPKKNRITDKEKNMDYRRETLNREIGKFKEWIVKFNELFAQENFSYNILESQFENLKIRNKKLHDQNELAQVQIKEALAAADKIKADALAYESGVKANASILFHKAQAKFREIEEALTKGEKKQINEHLEKLEALGV